MLLKVCSTWRKKKKSRKVEVVSRHARSTTNSSASALASCPHHAGSGKPSAKTSSISFFPNSSNTPILCPAASLLWILGGMWGWCRNRCAGSFASSSPPFRIDAQKPSVTFFFFISAKCAPWRDFTVSDIAKEFLVGKLLAKRVHGKVGMMQVTCSLGRALGLCRCCAVVLTCGLLPSFNMEVWCTTNTRARLQQNVGQSACALSRYPTEGRSDTCTTETGMDGSVGDNRRRWQLSIKLAEVEGSPRSSVCMHLERGRGEMSKCCEVAENGSHDGREPNVQLWFLSVAPHCKSHISIINFRIKHICDLLWWL